MVPPCGGRVDAIISGIGNNGKEQIQLAYSKHALLEEHVVTET